MSTATTDKIVELTTLPVTINATAIAKGMLDLFDENERTVLRFGMLPHNHIQLLERTLEDKFRNTYPNCETGDALTAVIDAEGWPRYVDFSMKKLVSECVHEVTLELYAHGDLVV